MSNLIIIDRKHKRANSDNNWDDALGVDAAKREKARTIEVPKDSMNPIHRFLREHSIKELIGRDVYCIKKNTDVLSGKIQDIIPPGYVLVRNKGVAKFDDVISIGG